MLDLLIRNGTVVTAHGSFALDVGVSRGSVAGLFDPGQAPAATTTIDASKQLVLPGFVDAHVHTRAPANPEREDFRTGTQAAAAGGVTTICEMPMSLPPANTAARVRDRREAGERDCYVDFALWGAGAAPAENIEAMAAEGVCGFKAFLHAAPPGREKNFEGVSLADDYQLYQAMLAIKPTGRYLAVHAEDEAFVRAGSERLQAAGRSDPTAHGESRPPFVENIAVAKLLFLAEALGVRLYLPHVSAAGAVELARRAKARGSDVVLETCPQYLLCDESVMARVGPYGRINPPIRPRPEVEALWQALVDGTVDVVASDHAPYLMEEKEPFWLNIWGAYCGHPGLETLGPSLLSECLAGRLPLERAVAVLSEGPAQAFGFYPRKGTIVQGGDADLVLFDPQAEWRVDRRGMFTKGWQGARLFDRAKLRGRIVRTLVRGEVVYEEGHIAGNPGHGRFVRPSG